MGNTPKYFFVAIYKLVYIILNRGVKMTKLVKGAKTTFGWSIVSEDRSVMIPPDAWKEYGFSISCRGRAGYEFNLLSRMFRY